MLDRMAVRYQVSMPTTDLMSYPLLIVGKSALTPDGPAPDIARVRDGLRVVVFEQTAAVLEQRFGFRIAEYGLREVFRACRITPSWPASLPSNCGTGAARRRCRRRV